MGVEGGTKARASERTTEVSDDGVFSKRKGSDDEAWDDANRPAGCDTAGTRLCHRDMVVGGRLGRREWLGGKSNRMGSGRGASLAVAMLPATMCCAREELMQADGLDCFRALPCLRRGGLQCADAVECTVLFTVFEV